MKIKKFDDIGICASEILLPNEDVKMETWSVVACDQYTSQPEYWEKCHKKIQDSPSTLNIILPEVYLDNSESDEMINKINLTMTEYLSNEVLKSTDPAFILIDRKTSNVTSRKGLVLCVDLDKYDYSSGSTSLIRATEGTVLERIPPRMKIRRNASIESPHIMLLIDDPEKIVIEPLFKKVKKNPDSYPQAYNFKLMMNGGRIKGYKITSDEDFTNISSALEQLICPEIYADKYDVPLNTPPMLFAVGDGNHSLASAKAFWEEIKTNLSEEELKEHPARYALVEVVNIHDEGIKFEPIHRVVFNVDIPAMLKEMKQVFIGNGSEFIITKFENALEAEAFAASSRLSATNNTQFISFTSENLHGVITIKNPPHMLEAGSLQEFLEITSQKSRIKVDYIHGKESVFELSSSPNNLGFLLPVMHKSMFFKTIITKGILPRKTFSMGEADEKRYYLECRKIVR